MRISRLQKKTWLPLILLMYLTLTVANSVVAPIGRGADEWAHYWYARFIADNGRLPQTIAEREAAGYKSDWPPLYHLLVAGLTFWVETDGPPTFKYRQDNIRYQLVRAQGPEAILHTEDEQWPWQQEILIWHLGRLLSIAFSVGTLLVTYRVAAEVFDSGWGRSLTVPARWLGQETGPSERGGAGEPVSGGDTQSPTRRASVTNYQLSLPPAGLALLATAVLAFNPRFLFTGMLFNYDSLTLLLASLFLLLAIRVAKGYHPRWGFVGLGLLAGLALVTKYLTAPLVLVVIGLAFWRAGERRGAEEQGSGGTWHSVSAPRTTHHAPRTTHYVSRFTFHVLRFALPFLLIISPWFAYLIRTFNEIDAYGPVLGVLAPLLRGDGSDRTVETLFAWLSGGQAPAPAHIEQQRYTVWQIITELPLTFWGNPIIRPYPLTWFIVLMSVLTLAAVLGLIRAWRTARPEGRRLILLLVLTCALPLPFMIIRLFGARDALESMQGRHILFLAGPAFATLFVWGLSVVSGQLTSFKHYVLRTTHYTLLPLLLAGSLAQLLFMHTTYPPLLPVQTTPLTASLTPPPEPVTLPGGSTLLGYELSSESDQALQVSLWWQAGDDYTPEDYQLELNLVDSEGQVRANWFGYQTQARYPTRAWEKGDIIRDVGWLPLSGLPADFYGLRWRLLGQAGEAIPWQHLTGYQLDQTLPTLGSTSPWVLWINGRPAQTPPLLRERETVQLTITNYQPSPLQLLGPEGTSRLPTSSSPTWATFIIGPDWLPGDYRLSEGGETALRVADNGRSFTTPEIWQPLAVNFAGKIKLLGYNLPTRRVQPGEGVPLTLFWQGTEWLGQDFVIFTRLIDNHGVVYGGYDRLARENYSTLLWVPGEIITDGFAVPVDPDTPDGVYNLSVGWYVQADPAATSLPIVEPDTGQPIGLTSVTIGPLKVGGPPPGVTVGEARPENLVKVPLGDQIELLGFDSKRHNQELELSFYWQALRQPEADYSVFVHVRNQAGETVTQKDQLLTDGVYPSSLWDVDEVIKAEINVPLGGVTPGQYQVVAGLYNFASGQRLAVVGAADQVIELEIFEIQAQ